MMALKNVPAQKSAKLQNYTSMHTVGTTGFFFLYIFVTSDPTEARGRLLYKLLSIEPANAHAHAPAPSHAPKVHLNLYVHNKQAK